MNSRVTPPAPVGPTSAFNTALAARLRDRPGVELGGSLYAVPPADRAAAARLLIAQQLWVHADVFADTDSGVSLDLIVRLADGGAERLDVHLLTADTLHALDTVCRPGVARVTFPFEDVLDVPAVAHRVRSAGAVPWLAISPTTALAECAEVLPHIDGLLVMLIEPGTRSSSDPTQLAKIHQAGSPVGVDGGVDEDNLDDVLAAGASYVVIGRRLFSLPPSDPTHR